MAGGLTAGEAVVFWLGGFSQDPKFPISGQGGPSYEIGSIAVADRSKSDPIESRKWVFPCKVDRLVPRTADGYFDESKLRYFEYQPTGNVPKRRINFWQYTPRKSEEPYFYFDTSRYAPVTQPASNQDPLDPPAATATSLNTTEPFYAFAFKKKADVSTTSTTQLYQFVNPDKFQIIHCGINDRWDQDAFKNRVSTQYGGTNVTTFPEGPFVGDISETIVNFTTETKLEDAVK